MACRDLGCHTRTRMSDLVAGDLVATVLGLERVIVNQHKTSSDSATLLKLKTASATTISVTPDHVIHLNGRFAPAAEASVGDRISVLSETTISEIAIVSISVITSKVVNPVTPSGTILAVENGGEPVLASTHPEWIAHFLLELPVFPFAATRLASYIAPQHFQAYYQNVEAKLAAALPSVQLASAGAPQAFMLGGILVGDGLFALTFLVYALALPLGVGSAAYLVTTRK